MRFTLDSYNASSVCRLCLFKSDISVLCITSRITGRLIGLSWRTRQGARRPQSLKNVLWRTGKFARHLLSSYVPVTTCSLLCVWRQTSSLTVNSTLTVLSWSDVIWSVVMFISLVSSWVCLVRQSLVQRLESTSVWIARWCFLFFQSSYFCLVKLRHWCMYWCLCRCHSNPRRLVGTERWCLDATNPIWSIANDSADCLC